MRRMILLALALCLTPFSSRAQDAAAEEAAPNANAEEIAALIAQLGDDDFNRREAAVTKLVDIGEPARAAVEQATESKDPEIAARAHAVLRKLALKDVEAAQVHVVGLYESRGGPAVVKVEAADAPVILVVCAYEGVAWDVQPAKGARVVRVIAAGYHRQTVQGVDAPVTTLSYDERSPFYFYTYDHNEKRFPQMVARVKELTGKTPSSFQGRYSFESAAFVVPFRFEED